MSFVNAEIKKKQTSYISADFAARRLRMDVKNLKKLADSGELNPVCLHNGNWFYHEKMVEKFGMEYFSAYGLEEK